MAWWWILVGFVVGAMVGVLLMGVLCANSANLYKDRMEWHDDE